MSNPNIRKPILPIPRNVWSKSLGKLLEDLVHDFLNKRGIPNWGRVGVSKGDIDIVIPDKLRNIVFIIEIKNPSGDYPFTPDDGGELVVRI